MKIATLIQKLETLAPAAYAETWDNVGLLIGDAEKEVDSALIALDMTEAVLQEAIANNHQLIITHHPLIFNGLKKINNHSATGRIVQRAIVHNIAIYAIHTNLDNMANGVNAALAKELGIVDPVPLEPKNNLLLKLVTFVPSNYLEEVQNAVFAAGAGQLGNYDSCGFSASGYGTFCANENANPFVGKKGSVHSEKEARFETILPDFCYQNVIAALLKAHPYEEPAFDFYRLENSIPTVGSGMIGHLTEPMTEEDFLRKLKRILNIPVLRYSECTNNLVQKIAFCGGAGAFLLPQAIAQKADVFITGDVKYHEFFMPEKKLLLVDAGHYETEQFVTLLLRSFLNQNFSTFAVQISQHHTNVVNYLI